MDIVDATELDYDGILVLNEAALPAVSVLSRDALARLHAESFGPRRYIPREIQLQEDKDMLEKKDGANDTDTMAVTSTRSA